MRTKSRPLALREREYRLGPPNAGGLTWAILALAATLAGCGGDKVTDPVTFPLTAHGFMGDERNGTAAVSLTVPADQAKALGAAAKTAEAALADGRGTASMQALGGSFALFDDKPNGALLPAPERQFLEQAIRKRVQEWARQGKFEHASVVDFSTDPRSALNIDADPKRVRRILADVAKAPAELFDFSPGCRLIQAYFRGPSGAVYWTFGYQGRIEDHKASLGPDLYFALLGARAEAMKIRGKHLPGEPPSSPAPLIHYRHR